MNGSNSSVAKSLTFITQEYCIDKFQLEVMNWSVIAAHLTVNNNETHQAIAGAIVDFVKMRNTYDTPWYIKEDVDDIILHLCTS